MSKLCPCCSGLLFEDCCHLYLSLKNIPQAPEILMRSRYTAFVLSDMTYIQNTMRGPALRHFSYDDSLLWSKQATWLRLEVIDASEEDGDQGQVEFKAYYVMSGIEKCLHERSLFSREDGRWYYVDSKKTRVIDQSAESARQVGRNDPCYCGSGKKYKKCCYGRHRDPQ